MYIVSYATTVSSTRNSKTPDLSQRLRPQPTTESKPIPSYSATTASYQQHLLSKRSSTPKSRSKNEFKTPQRSRSNSKDISRESMPYPSATADSTITSLTNSQVGYNYDSQPLDVSIDEVVQSYLGPSPSSLATSAVDSDLDHFHNRRFFPAAMLRPASPKKTVPRYFEPTLASQKKTYSRRMDYDHHHLGTNARSSPREINHRSSKHRPDSHTDGPVRQSMTIRVQPSPSEDRDELYLASTPHIPEEYLSFSSSNAVRMTSTSPRPSAPTRSSKLRIQNSSVKPQKSPSSNSTSNTNKMTKAQYALIYGSLAPQEDSKSWRHSLRN